MGLAVSLFTAGGLAALGDLRRRGYDTLSGSAPRAEGGVWRGRRRASCRGRRRAASRGGRASAMTPALAESAAIRYCETVTRSEARNFWYGIRLLPPTKRRLLAAVYAMARRIDDVADGDLAPTTSVSR